MNRGTAIIERPMLAASMPGGTMRGQLLGASLFPLVFFGLLSILVTASALYEMATRLVMERNTAQAQADAAELAVSAAEDPGLKLQQAVQGLVDRSAGEQVLVINASGQIMEAAGATLVDSGFLQDGPQNFIKPPNASSVSMWSPATKDQIILSYAPIPGTKEEALVFIQSWSFLLTPALNYQVLLLGLLVCGTLLSLLMLSVSIGRILQPIKELAASAKGAVPGSIFHPLPERGPSELQSLTASFNQMVIQLAEQQSALRQFAQQALLSQEEERQRLSHELHDGTVQGLVGLAQRLELCRSEVESNPARAKVRLDELRILAQSTINEVRQISNALRPSVLQDLGLPAALGVLCRELEQAMPEIQGEYRLNELPADGRRLQPDTELAIFRVAQEALTNIRKHARQVTQVRMWLNFDEQFVYLEVHDNGQGTEEPNISELVRNGHLGFAGMYERARLFGGMLEVTSAPESGTSIRMKLPW